MKNHSYRILMAAASLLTAIGILTRESPHIHVVIRAIILLIAVCCYIIGLILYRRTPDFHNSKLRQAKLRLIGRS